MTPKAGNAAEVLYESLVTGDCSAAIENQEKHGQQLLVTDNTLPKDMGFHTTREQFEAMGIVFGEDADDLFVNVRLPEGWSKQPTSHSMWSNLVDDEGRTRAMIFYKAAFYDRSAHIDIVRRFTYRVEPTSGYDDPDYRKSKWHVVVTDCGNIVWQSVEQVEREPDYTPGDSEEKRSAWLAWAERKDALGTVGKMWLDDNCPGWENPLACWDEGDFRLIAVIEGTQATIPWYERLYSWIAYLLGRTHCDES